METYESLCCLFKSYVIGSNCTVKIKYVRIMKQKLMYRFLIAFIQTLLLCLCMTARYIIIEPKGKLIIGTIFPFIIVIFLLIGLVQSVLVPIVNKKIFTWIAFTLFTGILTILFCTPFTLWFSLPFFLIIILILLIPTFFQKHFYK